MEKPHSIQQLVDIDRLRALFEDFSNATGFSTGFVSFPDQELLITTGWRDICTKFHRVCPASAACCKESNIYLTSCLKDLKELSIKRCGNGLVDAATPIIIRGVHLASLATGQVLLEKPDIQFFEKLAQKYGFDRAQYLAALAEVPVVSEKRLKSVLSFLSGVAVRIAEEALSRLEIQEHSSALQAANAALRKKEESIRTLSNNIPNGITYQLVHAQSGQSWLEFISDGVERLYGLPAARAVADIRYIHSAFHPDDAARLLEASAESARTLKPCDVEGRIIAPSGEVRWVHWRSTPRRLANGNTLSDGIATDITERKMAMEALRVSEERYRSVVDNIGIGIALISPQMEILSTNPQLRAWNPGIHFSGCRTCYQTFNKPPRAGVCPYCPTVQTLQDGLVHESVTETPFGGEIRNYRIVSSPVKDSDGTVIAAIEMIEDITARKRHERELLKVSEHAKQLIAQELHDGLCQHLAGTAMMSKLLQKRLQEKGSTDADFAKEICELLGTAVDEARNLSHGLYPVKDEPEGLMAALEVLTGTISRLFHIRCTLRCSAPVYIDNGTTATHLFRIAQESVNNAIKHGGATRILICLHYTEGGVTLSIRDNGVGLPDEVPTTGMGLKSMRHRAATIGASLIIRRSGKRGTLVDCTLPYNS